MKRVSEKHLVIVLFVLVIIVFSFADRDSRKLDQLYSTASVSQKLPSILKQHLMASSQDIAKDRPVKLYR